jgi:threonine/homoserine/homoserine lactone efflux protein
MNIIIFNFLAGAIVSFLGSLPVGVLNVTIVHIALRRGLSAAFYFALACALIEIIYSYIAVLLTQAAFHLEAFTLWFHIFSILVFMGAGIYYLRKKPSSPKSPNHAQAFYQGTVLSIMNVVAIPFWLIYTSLLSSHQWIQLDTQLSITYYIIGIALGTLLSLLGFALFSHKINQRFVLESVKVNRIMGLLLIGTSLLEVVYVLQ